MGSALCKEFVVKAGTHEGSVLWMLRFTIAVDVTKKYTKEGLMHDILSADDLVLMIVSMEILKKKFLKWKKAFESQGLKVYFKNKKNDGEWFESRITQKQSRSMCQVRCRVMEIQRCAQNVVNRCMETISK